MIVKTAAIFVLLGVCCALPVDEPKVVEDVPSVETTPWPQPLLVRPAGLPKPPSPDSSDLKPDASFWYPWYLYNYPTYHHYYVPSVPTYNYYWHGPH